MTSPTPERTSTIIRRYSTGAQAELIGAAERLFAQRGIEAVSLREVTRAANQRNTTALQYHFKDRDGLLRALLRKHIETVAVRRTAMLDLIQGQQTLTLRDAATTLLQPLVTKLTSSDGGPFFLQVAAELLHRAERLIARDEPAGLILYDGLYSLDRWAEMFDDLLPQGAAGAPLHRRFAVIRFAHIEVGRRARVGEPIDVPLFTSQLIDMLTGLLQAPLSEETTRLLATREARAKADGRKPRQSR